jgi:hypothetical protein
LSVFCENEGKMVTIVIPKRIARDGKLKILKCNKHSRDRDCNDCLAKYACAVFLDEQRFTLKTIVKAKAYRIRKK